MRRLAPSLGLAAVAVLAAPARAEDVAPVPAPAPAPAAAPDAGPARPPRTLALDRVARHAVLVSLRFQRDLRADAEGVAPLDPDAPTEVFRRWGMSLRVPGVVVRDRRTVLVADLYVPPGSVRSVMVEPATGPAVEGTLSAFLPALGAAVVTTQADLAAEPVPLDGAPPLRDDDRLMAGALAEGPHGAEAFAEPLSTVRRPAAGGALAFGRPARTTAGLGGVEAARTIDLVVREDGTPLGVRCGPGPSPRKTPWHGEGVLAELARAVPFDALGARAKALGTASHVHAVRLAFRAPSPDDELASWSAHDGALTPEPDPDARWWALAVAPDLLVVPSALPPSWVARLVKIQVEEREGPAIEGRYEGRLHDLGAFVVRLVGGTVDPVPAGRPPAPEAERAFLVHRVGWRAGARRDQVDYRRSLGLARGYADRAWLASETAVEAGSFLLDLEGRVLGAAVELVPDDEDAARVRGRPDGSRGVVAALFADLGEPAALAADLDRRVMPAPARGTRRLPWLGVEVEPIRGAKVADALDIAGPTRDGARGLLVNVVHAGSPAARAGIRPDDVLLSARRTGGTTADAPPVDLRDAPNAAEWPDTSEVPRPWAPRTNALVRLLEAWGEGTPYELEVLRDDAVLRLSTAVELGPRDVTTATEARDAETGLLVKELTYEVRQGLKLAADAPGVLVAGVEDGSAAAQARILPWELIVEVGGSAVDGPTAFAEKLAAARAAGQRELRVVVRRLDRTRFVDLRIGAGSPPK